MYVIVAYDAEPDEQAKLRRLLSKQLNRIQNSVFSGHLRRIETMSLRNTIEGFAETARVQMWVMPHEPEIHLIGDQEDEESAFV